MQKVEEDKSRMLLAAVTHELRNPLTLIGSYLQMLEGQYPEVENSDYWEIIHSELHHLNHLLNDFSLYQNELRICPELTPMSDWLEAYINTITPVLQSFSEVDFQREIAKELPVMSIDTGKIRQVLDNLIRNALEAMGADAEKETDGKNGSERREILKLAAYMKEGFLCMEVTDTGCGIKPDQREGLFKPFVTDKACGTGLGLPICRKIVRAHGGSITLSLSSSHETQFRVLLPAEIRR